MASSTSCLEPTASACASCSRYATSPRLSAGPGSSARPRAERAPPLACWGCHDLAVTDTFARLASDNDLEDQVGLSPEGLTERYLYSSNMMFRYAFGRWWGNTDLATTAIWVLLNPAG